MQEYTTKETAIKLAKNGFPQPEFVDNEMQWYWVEEDDARCAAYKWRVFAPTALEILAQMPGFALCNYDGHHPWFCTSSCTPLHGVDDVFFANNPAEACAAAWLALKEKEVA